MIVLLRGGGDLASGVALRLHRAGLRVAITELPMPLAVRRTVSFGDAVYQGETVIEGVTARRVAEVEDTLKVLQVFSKGAIPVLIDPDGKSAQSLHPSVIVDALMLKRAPEPLRHNARLFIGLGPGFVAGDNCHAAIETQRGHNLGRVLWQGAPAPDSGTPGAVGVHHGERVLRAPADGTLALHVQIGDLVEAGQLLAEVGGQPVQSPFAGLVRGLIHPDVPVTRNMKIGDVDPRLDPALCRLVSDKALAVGGGVLEAILARPELRQNFWS